VGVFLSVDRMVSKTGDPYLYAGGNPTTLSDPSGLCIEGDAKCGIDYDGSGLSRSMPVPRIGAGNLSISSGASVANFPIPVWQGQGVTRIQYFIETDQVCLTGVIVDVACGHGDNRGFAAGAEISDYNISARVRIVLDHESGAGMVIAYPTHGGSGDIPALPIQVTVNGPVELPNDYPSQLRVWTTGSGIDGNIVFDYRFINSETPKVLAGAAPAINGVIRIQRGDGGAVMIDGRLAHYPSVEIMHDEQLVNGYKTTLIFVKLQDSGGPLNLYKSGESFVAAG
jgi:hypothetical protein